MGPEVVIDKKCDHLTFTKQLFYEFIHAMKSSKLFSELKYLFPFPRYPASNKTTWTEILKFKSIDFPKHFKYFILKQVQKY